MFSSGENPHLLHDSVQMVTPPNNLSSFTSLHLFGEVSAILAHWLLDHCTRISIRRTRQVKCTYQKSSEGDVRHGMQDGEINAGIR